MLNIAIIDDEQAVIDKLKSYIEKYFSEEAPTEEFCVNCFFDGMKFLSSQHSGFDIVFMDICMPFKDGLEIAHEFRKNNEPACLIFVTNLADMAIRGYEVNALDFVVKPVEYGDFKYRMAKAVSRAKFRVRDCIVVIKNRLPTRITVQSIMYVETIYHRVIYHTVAGAVEEWGTMKQAEDRLRDYNFTRCNSGYLINLHFVDNIRNNNVYIGETRLAISRSRKSKVMDDMMKYLSRTGGGGYKV